MKERYDQERLTELSAQLEGMWRKIQSLVNQLQEYGLQAIDIEGHREVQRALSKLDVFFKHGLTGIMLARAARGDFGGGPATADPNRADQANGAKKPSAHPKRKKKSP